METRALLQQILTCVAKPCENNILNDDKKPVFEPILTRTRSEDGLLQKKECEKKMGYGKEIFTNDDPDDDTSSSDGTDIADQMPAKPVEAGRRKLSIDRLRIIADMNSRRPQSIDSARSITDDDSFDSAL